jgi:2,3-bisphosphoglycerate-dependent phosphoglycerate mutase
MAGRWVDTVVTGAARDAARRDGSRLILLRHGQSEYNAANLFTGWADPPLTARGEREAAAAGVMLAEAGLWPAVVHTSLLVRSSATAHLTLAAAGRGWIPVRRSWRLNGRHYGALQGRDKAQVRAEFGEELVARWRRSYEVRPPELTGGQLANDPRYAALPPELLPRAESLRDVLARLLPYWYDAIVPDLHAFGTVLVVAHGNTLRALVKHLDQIADDAIADLEIPTGIPLIYRLDRRLRAQTAVSSAR